MDGNMTRKQVVVVLTNMWGDVQNCSSSMEEVCGYTPSLLPGAVAACYSVAIVGGIGNILAIVCLMSSARRYEGFSVLLVTVFASLVPICCVCLPIYAEIFRHLYIQDGEFFRPEMQSAVTSAAVLYMVSWNLEFNFFAVIAFHSLIAVLLPHQWKALLTGAVTAAIITINLILTSFIWILSTILGLYKVDSCCGVYEMDHMLMLLRFSSITLPLIFYTVLWIKIRGEQRLSRNQHSNNKSTPPEWQERATDHIRVIFLAIVPFQVLLLAENLVKIPKTGSAAIHLIYFLHVCVTPHLYIWKNPEHSGRLLAGLRKLHVLCCCVRSEKRENLNNSVKKEDISLVEKNDSITIDR
ncbi:unnamed protein product [Meganyctiphanes norvegica]|uniref:G-protein coupled receptors family 1 profile domain-containing protein n=1 Tax=Meganyctiphanes norvegica TaxID=48144 RepID=A0AAV2QIG1_MEGNR